MCNLIAFHFVNICFFYLTFLFILFAFLFRLWRLTFQATFLISLELISRRYLAETSSIKKSLLKFQIQENVELI